MESASEYHAWREALEWQVAFGADEALSEAPVNRFELAEKPKPKPAPVPAVAPANVHVEALKIDAVAEAQKAADAAQDLAQLRRALAAFEHCELKRGARNLVFADGTEGARLMVIGEAPGREEDRAGLPFVGPAGQLLDKMLGAIALRREADVYLSTVLPWRPPHNREPSSEEIAMMRPFVARHVALAKPDMLVLMGNIACDVGLGERGVTRLRGRWTQAFGLPALPMFEPERLLREPLRKREAWADLLELKARLT
ncbi:uracil-DNA glycosylase [uncultured Lentibacter sp.]|jgi:DNA polymerase|uniref:uracil-DNA glycosylase n=1 Tax=uncultured Lentibacter sp. TaxID=1659309 RepID=UPI0026318A45|nr:uracil-DNA glycosylase [uncultured Lentibacter sp.]